MNNVSGERTLEDNGYLSSEFVAERAEFYTDRGNRVVVIGCGDEREPTEESAKTIAEIYPDAMDVRDGYARIYGGSVGIAKNVVIAGVAQYGPSFVEAIGGIAGAHRLLLDGAQAGGSYNRVIPTLHSAADKEEDFAEFNPSSTNSLGCAYAMGVGATSALLIGEDPLIRDIARDNQRKIFGDDAHVDSLLMAHETVLLAGTDGKGSAYALDRKDYADSGLAIMILAGRPHATAKSSGVISNFDLDAVSNSTEANASGKDFYSCDIALITAETLKIFEAYKLDPEILMRAIQLDSTPVRAVLASQDSDAELQGKLDPRNLAMGVIGDPLASIADLRARNAA